MSVYIIYSLEVICGRMERSH